MMTSLDGGPGQNRPPVMLARIYIWKKAPFTRLLFPLGTGILVEWYLTVTSFGWYALLLSGVIVPALFAFLPLFKKYRLGVLNGIAFFIAWMAVGGLLTRYHDIRNSPSWIGHQPGITYPLVATLSEIPVEKAKSYKSNAHLSRCFAGEKERPVQAGIIVYFKKTSGLSRPRKGSRIVFSKPLQEIQRSGNPGAFDYKRYALFQGITHQVFLEPGQFAELPLVKNKWLDDLLHTIRVKLLSALRANIKNEEELGLAEALLIGYKDDLDKSVVQSYTNTGVVHIIAISGLHLGLIYGLLVLVLGPLRRYRFGRWARPAIILCGLWLFTLLAGAQPSILRSAVMFSCLVLGEGLTKRTSIYNTLALSAFLLLVMNPYWLWDLGFQLSYAAVLSIVIFMRPVYDILYIQNRLLDILWKLNAVTIAAQVLTVPISIYHFHQFPILFLFTNFVAVPLSSLILMALLFLCIAAPVPAIAAVSGEVISWMIRLMTGYIQKMESISFALWDGLQINVAQTILLFIFIACLSYWLLERKRTGLVAALLAICSFLLVRCHSFRHHSRQKKIIIYNVAKHQAIDLVNGRKCHFIGDPGLEANHFASNFHLRPSRTLQRIETVDSMRGLIRKGSFLSFMNKKILLADSSFRPAWPGSRATIDLLIISNNSRLQIPRLNTQFAVGLVVFDGAAPAYRKRSWKKDCDSLRIPWHDVSEKGAFVMNLN